jgi:hypothetical protein
MGAGIGARCSQESQRYANRTSKQWHGFIWDCDSRATMTRPNNCFLGDYAPKRRLPDPYQMHGSAAFFEGL